MRRSDSTCFHTAVRERPSFPQSASPEVKLEASAQQMEWQTKHGRDSDYGKAVEFATALFPAGTSRHFVAQRPAERGKPMNADTTTQTPFPTSTETATGSSNGSGLNGDANRVRRMAQSLHEAVDSLEQKFGSGSERIMGLQEEYGNMARDQVRANPLAALGAAFAAGFIIAKILR